MRNSLIILTALVACLMPTRVWTQPPPGYYSSSTGLYGTSLKQALHTVISAHNTVAYNTIHEYFKATDAKPDSTVWDMYSDIPGGIPPYVYHFIPQDQCGNYSKESDCYNREHSFPSSWFGGNILPMYTDLFHIYPTDGFVNAQRGNFPYGVVQTASWTSQNGSKRGSSAVSGYTGIVFEPLDAYKGDFARTMFYMAVRYLGQDASWPGSDMTSGAEPKPWALAMLRQWHQQDPVSQKEMVRNNAVFAIQNNRNPFIDHPQFVEDIWSPTAGALEYHTFGLRLYPVPANGQVNIQFSKPLSSAVQLSVVSITAKASHQLHLSPGLDTYTMDVSDLPPGIYILRLQAEMNEEGITRKMVILR